MPEIRPLRNLIVIQPDPPATETASGFLIPNAIDQPAMSGRVVALGDGPARDARVRTAAVSRCLTILDDAAVESATKDDAVSLAKAEMQRYLQQATEIEHICQIGDRVLFPMEAGYEVTISEDEDSTRIFISEDAIVAVCEPSEEIACR